MSQKPPPKRPRSHLEQPSRRSFGLAASAAALHSALPGWAHALQPRPQESVLINSHEIAYLMADRAIRSPALQVRTDETHGTVKRFWVQNWRQPDEDFAWHLHTQRGSSFQVTLMISAPASTRVQIEGPTRKIVATTTAASHGGFAWDRITLPDSLTLPAGGSTLRIRLLDPVLAEPSGAALKSIELLDTAELPRMQARLRSFKSDTAWLNQAKFGFMTQCGEWAYPSHGPHQPWPQMVDQFNVEAFADKVQSTGAGYAVWSATWATFFFPAPIHAIDAILPGRTSSRDLIGEIADALHKRNIRLILYYHLGHDVTPANGNWWSKNWVSPDDKTLFVNNWCSIITEVGQRYGQRLAGWLFDDELIYYPAPYERLGAAAKAGNPSRLISYNPWIQARGTDFQDFQFGEGFTGSSSENLSPEGIYITGPMQGLHAHGNFQIDGPNWGVTKAESQIEPPHFTPEKAAAIATSAAAKNIALSWNMLMYDDGTVAEASLDLLEKVGQDIRKLYPEP